MQAATHDPSTVASATSSEETFQSAGSNLMTSVSSAGS